MQVFQPAEFKINHNETQTHLQTVCVLESVGKQSSGKIGFTSINTHPRSGWLGIAATLPRSQDRTSGSQTSASSTKTLRAGMFLPAGTDLTGRFGEGLFLSSPDLDPSLHFRRFPLPKANNNNNHADPELAKSNHSNSRAATLHAATPADEPAYGVVFVKTHTSTRVTRWSGLLQLFQPDANRLAP